MIRTALRWLLALFYAVAGIFHLADPAPFLRIVPDWVPWPEQAVFWTGAVELAGALALAQPWSMGLRRAGAIGLALYALAVWPANFHHFMLDMAQPGQGWGLAYHVPRLAAQPLIVWLALWTGGVTEWPFARRA